MGCSLRLNMCCCGCSLRTGTLIIGTIGWILTTLQIFYAPVRTTGNYHDINYDRYQHIGRIIGCVLVLVIDVLLIVGVFKQKKVFMLPWLVLKCIGFSILSILFLWACFAFTQAGYFPANVIIFMIIFLLFCLFNWYCWLCVWSHYMALSEDEGLVAPSSQVVSPPPPYRKNDIQLV